MLWPWPGNTLINIYHLLSDILDLQIYNTFHGLCCKSYMTCIHVISKDHTCILVYKLDFVHRWFFSTISSNDTFNLNNVLFTWPTDLVFLSNNWISWRYQEGKHSSQVSWRMAQIYVLQSDRCTWQNVASKTH